MAEEIILGKYLIAFIDVIGQRSKLEQLVKLPQDEKEIKEAEELIFETSEHIKNLRKQFYDYFHASHTNTGLLDKYTPEQKAWFAERKTSHIWYKGFSDSFVITIPCIYDKRYGINILDIYNCLFGIGVLQLWSLVMEKPIRGGIEIHIGTEIETNEVYGPVVAKAYQLENYCAGYPRVLISEGLINHLKYYKIHCPKNMDGKHALINIKNCESLITKDNDSKYILDFIGEGIKSVHVDFSISSMVDTAYHFVVSQQIHFKELGDTKLFKYYSDLRNYIETRLSIWDVQKEP